MEDLDTEEKINTEPAGNVEKRIRIDLFARTNFEQGYYELMHAFMYTEKQAGRSIDYPSAYLKRYYEFKRQ